MNPMFGAISAKFRTFDIAMFFAIPPSSASQGLLEVFLFPYQRYEISNTLVINLLEYHAAFRTIPNLSQVYPPDPEAHTPRPCTR